VCLGCDPQYMETPVISATACNAPVEEVADDEGSAKALNVHIANVVMPILKMTGACLAVQYIL
jgi:hypothetical protein